MNLQDFLYGVYPYLAGTVFLVGSLLRFDRDPYTWKSDSSQLLSKRHLRLGSNLFHVGILSIFLGHLVGLLTPHALFRAVGISDLAHQYVAIIAGTIFGVMAMAGGILLWRRRVGNSRVRAAGKSSDLFILTWLLVTLGLGLSTIPFSLWHAGHGNPEVMVSLAEWAQSVVTFQPDPALLASVDTVFKIHIFFGMTVFLLFPFTRLVHIWSAPFGYLVRAYQIVRMKRPALR
ncbi:MAG TPA: respiratory nitrate reductase subunit gamma [Gammaproteobacteria bacterium]|nr:respiratory nitrate reductase subunit gamma [Gammaproteobacteria bacterium]